jgi:hypothetical protein
MVIIDRFSIYVRTILIFRRTFGDFERFFLLEILINYEETVRIKALVYRRRVLKLITRVVRKYYSRSVDAEV